MTDPLWLNAFVLAGIFALIAWLGEDGRGPERRRELRRIRARDVRSHLGDC